MFRYAHYVPLRPAKTTFCLACMIKLSIQFGGKKGALHPFNRLHVKESGMNIAVRRHGAYWQARVRFRGADGTVQEKSKSLGIPCDASSRGKKVARAAAEKWVKDAGFVEVVEQNQATRLDCSAYTYCLNYFKSLVATQQIERRSYTSYKNNVRYVDLFFGEKRLQEITVTDVELYVSWLYDSGYSANTIKKAFNSFRSCTRHAVAIRDLQFDPCSSIKAPKGYLAPPNPLNEPSRKKLQVMLSALELSPMVLATYLAYYTGMRREECCGLKWKDLNLKAEDVTAHLCRAISYDGGKTYIKGLKNGKTRTVPVPTPLVDILKQWRSKYIEDCMLMGIAFNEDMYVIGDFSGEYLKPERITGWWKNHSEEWGLMGTQGKRPVFHDLRHTYATIAVRTMDIKSAQDILGHSDINMTMRYADTDMEQLQRAGRAIGEALNDANKDGAEILQLRRAV
nr:MAG TPA: Integrase [Caudoviricetes sp.]